MSVKEFQPYHGAVLATLLRNDRPVSLRMIETRPQDTWAAYTINDEVTLYIKYSTKPSVRKREENALVWTFTFAPEHLEELRELYKQRKVYIALVCGQRNIEHGNMQICFLEPTEFEACIDITAVEVQNISVKYLPRKKLRVWGGVNTATNPILVANSKLEKWAVPGS